jgi:spore coat protein CotF
MMNEKDIVNDYLTMIKGSLSGYSKVISEASNPQLRQTFQQMRDQDEQRQQRLSQVAIQKGYYKPSSPATQDEISCVSSEFTKTF